MAEIKKFELPDEIIEGISGGKLQDDWKFTLKMSVLAYRNYYNRPGGGGAKIEDVLAEMDSILKNVRVDPNNKSDIEADRKLVEDYIRELWNS